MEVKIGVQHSPRELTVDTAHTHAEVEKLVATAMSGKPGGVLSLTDEKGRTVIVPAERITYIEIAESDARRVGFSVT